MQDDGSIDEAVIIIFIGTIALIVFEAIDIQTADFSPSSFGMALAAMWTAGAGMMRIRPPTPPQTGL
jgi:hypothetical protein